MRGVVARAQTRSSPGVPPRGSGSSRPPERQASVRLLADRAHYEQLIAEALPTARVSVWISTANLKELRVPAPLGSRARARGEGMSLLEQLESLGDRGVELRVLHGRDPSTPFAQQIARRPRLKRRLKLRQCPRVHFKVVVVDGRLLYLGSANLTGAGLGARSTARRNFELGILTSDEYLLDTVQAYYEAVWTGLHCSGCTARRWCPKPLDGG